MDTLDWGEMMELSAAQAYYFSAEKWRQELHWLYNNIVLNSDTDNDDIRSMFLNAMGSSQHTKLKFVAWLSQYTDRGDGNFTYKEILQFINYITYMSEKRGKELETEASFL